MKLLNSFKKKCTTVNSETFTSLALELFRYQAENCQVYKNYLSNLSVDVNSITAISGIPCLPIEFFKSHIVKTADWSEEEVYLSSGTTGDLRSRHYIQDSFFYLDNAQKIFEQLYGPLDKNIFFALLPSYQEQGQSSLVKMVDHFIQNSDSGKRGGFYLNKMDALISDIQRALESSEGKLILFGVGYALLDLAEAVSKKNVKLDGLTIIETGGMKGRRKEMVKSEFYKILKEQLGDISIHSEYGMTELLSQAYAFEDHGYRLPLQMKVLIRDPEDPFAYLNEGRTGGINIIDLANVHSCAFIETSDLGKLLPDGKFEVLGRLDNSDIRGCNLMAN